MKRENLLQQFYGAIRGIIVPLLGMSLLLAACDDKPLNNPHTNSNKTANVLYSDFTERPKTLDPARSYSSNEAIFTSQIYEPPLQYHYLKRPYTLEALTATQVPKPVYLDKNGKRLADNALDDKVAYSVYNITIKPGIKYQPHPALAKNAAGQYRYHQLTSAKLAKIHQLSDFKHTGTRELIAEDYVYEIKSLAHPQVQSPIFGLMSRYIVGLKSFSDGLQKTLKSKPKQFIDLRTIPLAGVKIIDRYTYQIKIKGKYPQFLYWLAMPFFAPVPWEAKLFYSQAGMREKNISFDWYPIGTGPYMLTVNDPNGRMVLEKNPNFHGEKYPSIGSPGDKKKGFLQDAGKALPFVDKVVFSLEKEGIPRWSKFLQGYYDKSGITSDSFDQAIVVGSDGKPDLTAEMKQKGIRLQTSIEPSIFYVGFNMLDEVVGGYSKRARKLRQAISIALDFNEFIAIFLNGRGIVAHSPLPPGIFGYQTGKKGLNPYVFEWKQSKVQRKSIAVAQRLLAEAGYPHGRDLKTGKPLVLNYDVTSTSGPDDKARFSWMRKQFSKLGIQLNVRATQYNRFQEKIRRGNAQLFTWGWVADYPDPENFLFLLYGPNGKAKYGGENAVNYNSPTFNKLFSQTKNMPNNAKRQVLIKKMLAIVTADSPWVWGYHPKSFQLNHVWNRSAKPNAMARNTLKYARIDPNLRAKKQHIWNKPIWWPLILLALIIVLSLIPVVMHYWRKEHRSPR